MGHRLLGSYQVAQLGQPWALCPPSLPSTPLSQIGSLLYTSCCPVAILTSSSIHQTTTQHDLRKLALSWFGTLWITGFIYFGKRKWSTMALCSRVHKQSPECGFTANSNAEAEKATLLKMQAVLQAFLLVTPCRNPPTFLCSSKKPLLGFDACCWTTEDNLLSVFLIHAVVFFCPFSCLWVYSVVYELFKCITFICWSLYTTTVCVASAHHSCWGQRTTWSSWFFQGSTM